MYRPLAVLVVLIALGLTAWHLARDLGGGGGGGPRVQLGREDGVTILRLAGTPREMGRAHGEALRDAIRAQLARARPTDPGVAAFAIDTCSERLAPALPPAYRAEIEGVAEGAGITFDEALFLQTRFELAAFGMADADSPWAGEGAAAAGPEVVLELAPSLASELVVFVRETGPEPLVLVGLPGMAGGFLGVRGRAAAALRPAPGAATPALSGLVWTLLLRLLLEEPPRDHLPADVTGAASVAMVMPDGAAGTLSLGPAGAAWYAGGAASPTTGEAPGGGGRTILLGARDPEARAAAEARARSLLADGAPGVRLARTEEGLVLALPGHRVIVLPPR